VAQASKEGMVATRRDPQRRAQLLEAADRAVAQHGPSVRMEDIAAEAGVTKPILYRHFGDKGGMYEAMARRTARLLQDRLEVALDAAEGPRAKLSATVEAFLAAVEERPEVYRFLLHRAAAERPEVTQAVGDFTHQLARRFATVLHEQFARFGLEVAHADLVAHAMIGAVHQVSDWWLSTGGTEPDPDGGPRPSRAQLHETLVTLLWSGLPSLGGADAAVAADDDSVRDR
jgi:AcrR family transcriptional regulator